MINPSPSLPPLTRRGFQTAALVLLVLALPLLLYLPHLSDFPAPYQMHDSDMIGSHYPNALFLRQSLAEWGQIPLWSDAILGGYPFAANPLSGLFYPPGWLMLFLDLPLAFNLTILLHLFLGGLGMYCFLRGEGFDLFPALLGALLFELMPKLFGHYAAGHVTLLYALCWAPWLLWAEQRRSRQGGLAPALVLAVALLASVPGAAYAGLLWACYSLRLALPRFNPGGWRFLLRWAGGLLFQLGLAALLAAPFLLLFTEYAGLSNRSLMTPADTYSFSLPPLQLLSLLVPNFGAFPEWVIYPSGLAFVSALACLLIPDLRRRSGFWLGVLAFGLLAGLGESFPVTAWLFRLPFISSLRVPARLYFLCGVAFAVLSTQVLQTWQDHTPFAARKDQRRLAFTLPLPALVAGLLTLGMAFAGGDFPAEFAWGFAALAFAALLLWLRALGRLDFIPFAVLALSLAVVDLLGAGYTQFNFRPAREVLSDGGFAPEFIAALTLDDARVYSPTLSIPQQRAAELGLELAGGVDPMHPLTYLAYFSRSSGIPVDLYSVTLPPLPFQNGLDDYQSAPLDTVRLGRLNVAFVASEYPLDAPALTVLAQINNIYIYANADLRPRAWVQPDALTFDPAAPAAVLLRSPNRIEVQADGPGVLVLSETAYPGWQVKLDGQPAELLTIDGLLRGVQLGPGAHQVVFIFRPPLLIVGAVLQALSIAGVLLFWFFRRRLHLLEDNSHA